MRIVSRFHDYYDVVQAHGADDGLLMLRETVEHKDKEAEPFAPMTAHLSRVISTSTYNPTRKWSQLAIASYVIVFVGKPYIGFKVRRTLKEAPHAEELRYVYDLNELNTLIMEHDGKSIFEPVKSRWERRSRVHWTVAAAQSVSAKSYSDLTMRLKAPIILATHATQRGTDLKYITYPVLKDLCFFKVLQPWQAYQELSMFLGNIAAPDRVPVTVADKDRINQHGFDMQYSFRKRPNEN